MAETFGRYTVLDRLGVGALGELFRARDTTSGRTVALRVVSNDLLDDADRRARLLADLRAATRLSHPGIAALYEVVEEGEGAGPSFFVQEFVPGASLTQLADGRPMPERLAIGYALEVADALADAHAMGIEHGYLTGANVMVTPKGRVKLLDVGFAGWTRAGGATRRPDVPALGSLLSELVTGRPSAARGTVDSRTVSMRDDVGVVVAAMADGEGGYESMATAAAALRTLAESRDAQVPAPVPPPFPPRTRGASHNTARPALRWGLVLLAALAAAVAVWVATGL